MSFPSTILPFTYTPLETIEPTHARLNKSFATLKSYPLEFRLEQLNKLYWAIKDNEQLLYDALQADFNKPLYETYMTEVAWLQLTILDVMKNLREWAADEPMDVPLSFKLTNSPHMRKEPMGTILIIGPSNYPAQLVIHPFIGAIAGGNAAVIKPSELTPNTSAVVTKIMESMDPSLYAIVNGSVAETTKLLDLKWDKIVYTGSSRVGRIIAAAAAKHLTPVLLELGGLNPVFVTESADAKLSAKRVAWGKIHNAGQVCIGPDYILIHPSKEQDFVQSFIQSITTYLPNGAMGSPDMASIIEKRSFHRIKGLLERSKGSILYGGKMDEATRFIEPTLVKVTDPDDALLSEEIFGPIIPMLVVERVDEMLSLAKRIGDTPLAMYVFSGDKAEQEYMMRSFRSGGCSINDIMLHACMTFVPFGGVGESGHGKYRGRDTFDSFVHKRPVMSQPGWLEGQLKMRYPPYSPEKFKLFNRLVGDPSPQYPRNWKATPTPTWLKALLLGASTKKGGALRYLFVILAVLAIGRTSLGSSLGLQF